MAKIISSFFCSLAVIGGRLCSFFSRTFNLYMTSFLIETVFNKSVSVTLNFFVRQTHFLNLFSTLFNISTVFAGHIVIDDVPSNFGFLCRSRHTVSCLILLFSQLLISCFHQFRNITKFLLFALY